MSEDEGTNADAQAVQSEEEFDDESASEIDSGGESDADTDAETIRSDREATDLERALETLEDQGANELGAEIDTLREYVRDSEETIESLRTQLQEYEDEIEDLEDRLKRKQADFQNYKKRAKKRQEQLQERATEDLVERLVGVRDNLKRALEEESDDVDSLREGLEMTLREFDRVLEDENVVEIDPEPGSEVDPQRHEVMMNVDSDQPEGTVADVFTPGYEMGDKVIQNAQVTVSNGELDEEDESAGSGE